MGVGRQRACCMPKPSSEQATGGSEYLARTLGRALAPGHEPEALWSQVPVSISRHTPIRFRGPNEFQVAHALSASVT